MRNYLYLITLIILFLFVFCKCETFASELIVENTTKSLISEQVDHDKSLIEVSYNSLEKLKEAKSKFNVINEIELKSLDYRNKSFTILIRYNNLSTLELRGRYNLFVDAPVAKRAIKIGEIITTRDVSTVKLNIEKLGNYLSQADLVIGAVLIPGAAAPKLISKEDLKYCEA